MDLAWSLLNVWVLVYAPLLDRRAKPVIDVAVFYPNTANKLDDRGVSRLDGDFFTRVYSLRAITDHDFAAEPMILDGDLDRYKVLVFLSGHDDGEAGAGPHREMGGGRRSRDHRRRTTHRGRRTAYLQVHKD